MFIFTNKERRQRFHPVVILVRSNGGVDVVVLGEDKHLGSVVQRAVWALSNTACGVCTEARPRGSESSTDASSKSVCVRTRGDSLVNVD